METDVVPAPEIDQSRTCPNCESNAVERGVKTDLGGRVLAHFYECAQPECRRTWWVDVEP
jgi:hypothetical protein